MLAWTGVTLGLHVCTPNSLLAVFYIAVVLMKQLASNSLRPKGKYAKGQKSFPF